MRNTRYNTTSRVSDAVSNRGLGQVQHECVVACTRPQNEQAL